MSTNENWVCVVQDLLQACLLALTSSINVNVCCRISTARPWLHRLFTDSVSIEGSVSMKTSSWQLYWSCSQGLVSSRVGFNRASSVTVWTKIRDTLKIIIFTWKGIFHKLDHCMLSNDEVSVLCMWTMLWFRGLLWVLKWVKIEIKYRP